MEFIGVNLLATILATLAAFILGWLWYSPVLFLKPWLALSGQKMPKDAKPGAGTIIIGLLSTLVMAFIVGLVLSLVNLAGALPGAAIGVVLWFGLVATTTTNGVLYEGKSWELWMLNNSYLLLSLAIIGAIHGAMG